MRQPRFFFENIEFILKHAVFTGATVRERDHKIVVVILITEKLFKFILRFPPFAQDVGYRLLWLRGGLQKPPERLERRSGVSLSQ